MNDHRKGSPRNGRQEEVTATAWIDEIKKDPVVEEAGRVKISYHRHRQLRSRVPQFQREKNENKGDRRGQVVVLDDIAQGTPDRTTKKGNLNDRNHTVVEKYFYKNEKGEKITFNLSLFIPKGTEIKPVLAHKGGNLAHFRVKIGDVLVHIYDNDPPVPGSRYEGLGEVKVSKSKRPNIGSKYKLYSYINFYVGYGGDRPMFSVGFDSTERGVPLGAIDFSHSWGKNKTIIHLDPLNQPEKSR